HDDVSFGRAVGHGISPENSFVIFHFQVPELEFVPVALEYVWFMAQFRVWRNIDRFIIYGSDRNVYLNISTRLKLKRFSGRQFHHKFLDECRYVVVGNDFAFPFLDTEDLFRYTDLQILLYLYLASEPHVAEFFLAATVARFGRQHVAAAFFHHAFAHGAGSATATGRRKEDLLVRQGSKQGASSRHGQRIFSVTVNDDFYRAGLYEFCLRKQQYEYEQENDERKSYNRS